MSGEVTRGVGDGGLKWLSAGALRGETAGDDGSIGAWGNGRLGGGEKARWGVGSGRRRASPLEEPTVSIFGAALACIGE